MSPRSRDLSLLLLALLLCLGTGALGAIASINAPAFYAQLNKPAWAPPAGIFGPVWTTLYLLMAIALWLVWRKEFGWHRATVVFIAQLLVNALWSWLFFAWHLGAGAMIDVLVLWCLIVLTIKLFWSQQRIAALLLLPYLLWVSFASLLTWTVWQANPLLLQ